MNLISIQLQLFLRESIRPQKLAAQTISHEEFSKWKSFITSEAELVTLGVQSLETDPYHEARDIQRTISQLSSLSNIVNRYQIKYWNIWRKSGQFNDIKIHYLYTCNVIENLLTFLYEQYPIYGTRARITHFSLAQAKMDLKKSHIKLTKMLQGSKVADDLKEILLAGLFQFINKKNLTHGEEGYLIDLISTIDTSVNLTTDTLVELLIRKDFNIPEFFLYCVNKWQKKLEDIQGLHEQKEMLLKERHQLFDLNLKYGTKLLKDSLLYQDLNIYLEEKYTYIKQLIKLRREALQDQEKAKLGQRFLINLPVPQFGLFIRMQMEKGILVKENVGEIFNFFATHFYTANAPFISPESLQKKSTDVEFSTAQKLKGHLIGMLNWINTNYNLSNYN